ncbi:MAG: glutathione S-transferase family protein [Alphaproteobacteria bacterium]|nr:glutathione S-transferase family protein [Alphaproteobacteria bacterium]
MLTFYAIPVSLYCAKLRILLRHKAALWEERLPPGGYGSDAYKEVVPSGNLPALIDGDLLLGDSEAIAEYLNEKLADPPMLPKDPARRAKIRELSRFHDTRLEPELRKLFAHFSPADRDGAVTGAQSKALTMRLAQLALLLEDNGPTTARDLSLADCGFAISFAWISALTPIMGLEITWPAAVQTYWDDIACFPAIATEIADYQPKLDAFLVERTAS